jgi:hypothetical protein
LECGAQRRFGFSLKTLAVQASKAALRAALQGASRKSQLLPAKIAWPSAMPPSFGGTR